MKSLLCFCLLNRIPLAPHISPLLFSCQGPEQQRAEQEERGTSGLKQAIGQVRVGEGGGTMGKATTFGTDLLLTRPPLLPIILL